MYAGEGVKKRELSYTVGRHANWFSHYGKQYRGSSKTKNRVALWSSVPLLGIYPDKIIIQKDICTPMFIVTLFSIVKT